MAGKSSNNLYCGKMLIIGVISFFLFIPSPLINGALVGDETPIKLEKLNIFVDNITLSGFSAGASMTTQMHLAHSSLFSGVAMFSQVFYRCGPKNILQFGIMCSLYGRQFFPYSVDLAIQDARQFAENQFIDPLENLKDDKVFIWTGAQDEYVPLALVKKNKEFYETFIKKPGHVSLNVNERAKHLLPTRSYGGKCDEDASKNVYLGNCNYSGATHALKFLLGDQVIKSVPISKKGDLGYDPSSLRLYDQAEFHSESSLKEWAAMGDKGYIYIPKKCQQGQQCYLHINFHGCNEYDPPVARRYIENNEFLPLAEKNGIILVFPLTAKRSDNMDGCWDFYSYTNSQFATKNGRQIGIIYAIIQRLLHGKHENLVIV